VSPLNYKLGVGDRSRWWGSSASRELASDRPEFLRETAWERTPALAASRRSFAASRSRRIASRFCSMIASRIARASFHDRSGISASDVNARDGVAARRGADGDRSAGAWVEVLNDVAHCFGETCARSLAGSTCMRWGAAHRGADVDGFATARAGCRSSLCRGGVGYPEARRRGGVTPRVADGERNSATLGCCNDSKDSSTAALES